ncbi:MAG: FadR/GntR family transcriptional regulator [Chloroflexota bacterium]
MDNMQFPVFSVSSPQTTVVERIINSIADALIEGRLKPGQQLPAEKELAAQLDVSRNALREAMKILQALGVIEVQHGTGTFITKSVSPHLLNPLVFAMLMEANISMDLIELRMFTETGYYILAARNATHEDWTRIEAAQQSMEAYVSNPSFNPEHYADLDLAFHDAILEATHNPLVMKIGRAVEKLFHPALKIAFANPEHRNYPLADHRFIVKALRSGDVAQIQAAIERSLLESPVRDQVSVPREGSTDE